MFLESQNTSLKKDKSVAVAEKKNTQKKGIVVELTNKRMNLED